MSRLNFVSMKICRVCEVKANQWDLRLHENRAFVKKLRACADILIDVNDELPKYLCSQCCSDLEYSYKFKIRCEYTDRKFRDAIENGQNMQDDEGRITIRTIKVEPVVSTDWVEYNFDVCSNDDEAVEVSESNKDIKDEEIPSEYLEDYVDEEILEIEPFNVPEKGAFNRAVMETITDGEATTVKGADSAVMHTIDAELNQDQMDLSNSDPNSTKNSTNLSDVFSKAVASCRRAKKIFQCDTCEATFTDYLEFHQHNRTHGRERYQCNVCEKWFSKRYHLKNHMAIHTMEKSFLCTLCPNKYTNQGNLDRHIRVFHKKEKRYECTECGKSFSQTTILRQHMTIHTDERNFACEICGKKFKAESYMLLHRNRHLPSAVRRKPSRRSTSAAPKPPPKTCVCTECGKRFNSTTLFMSHKRTHSGEKPYECDVCKKRFSFQQSLRNHKLLHTGEKPYKCDICHLSFRQIGHLQGHKYVHNKQKPHACIVCGKSFALRGNLNVHLRLHTGQTPFHCSVCPKKFYDSNGLKRHRQMHEQNYMNDSQFDMNVDQTGPYEISVIDRIADEDDKRETNDLDQSVDHVDQHEYIQATGQSVIVTDNLTQYTIEVPTLNVDPDENVVYTIP